jgi:hypothetical protein
MFDGGCGDRDVDLEDQGTTTGYLDMESLGFLEVLLVIVMLSVPMHPSTRARVAEIAR